MEGKIRFAPSPTGYLHEGHLLSALYVWAAARKWGLQIHLRIEDHDRGRARPEYIDSIYEDLEWFRVYGERVAGGFVPAGDAPPGGGRRSREVHELPAERVEVPVVYPLREDTVTRVAEPGPVYG